MTITRIGHVEPVPPGKKPGRSDPVEGIDRTDTISLTPEARKKAETYQVVELIKSAPEMDDVRIAELRQKIDDPAYLNETVINATADKILSSWLV
ncbi:MAG: flagellar biosynthesis anti-sigma factor FlgM [Treponema sp.]|jgi:negative regulator of flagellin synthesis FlgM|nr:flagellar biosynthesis anti-sigma factor FlgM [Treponema sp.]